VVVERQTDINANTRTLFGKQFQETRRAWFKTQTNIVLLKKPGAIVLYYYKLYQSLFGICFVTWIFDINGSGVLKFLKYL